jgi:hypothetical protein
MFRLRREKDVQHEDKPAPRVGGAIVVASAEDDDAVRLMVAHRAGELARVQGRAEKWTAGLAALTGVLTTALVVKGPDNFSKLGTVTVQGINFPGDTVVIVLMVAGGSCLAVGIYNAYRAANGSPLTKSAVDEVAAVDDNVDGAAKRWRRAVRETVADSKKSLKAATISTAVAGLCLTGALVVTWTFPAKSTPDTLYCAHVW